MRAKVAERGQVTIPLQLRRELGIKPGTLLEFKIRSGKLIAVKAESSDSVAQVYGCLERSFDTDNFLDELRGSE